MTGPAHGAVSAVTVLVVPCREPGRWRARVTGTDPDGRQRSVTREAWDREWAVREGVSAWYAGDEGSA